MIRDDYRHTRNDSQTDVIQDIVKIQFYMEKYHG